MGSNQDRSQSRGTKRVSIANADIDYFSSDCFNNGSKADQKRRSATKAHEKNVIPDDHYGKLFPLKMKLESMVKLGGSLALD